MQGYSNVFRHLAKYCNLDDPEEVKEFIAHKPVSEGRKKLLIDYYKTMVRKPPTYVGDGWRG